jgi:hypothetical protein
MCTLRPVLDGELAESWTVIVYSSETVTRRALPISPVAWRANQLLVAIFMVKSPHYDGSCHNAGQIAVLETPRMSGRVIRSDIPSFADASRETGRARVTAKTRVVEPPHPAPSHAAEIPTPVS